MDELKDGGAAGGAKPGQQPPPAQNPPAPAPSGDSNDGYDDFGYALPKGEGNPPAPAKADDKSKPPAPAKPPEEDGTVELTGYEEDVKPPEKPADPPPAVEETKLDFELKFEEFSASEAEETRKFMKEHKVPKEIAEAFVKRRQDQIKAQKIALADAQKKEETALTEKRVAWQKELKEDKTFGGQNYKQNVENARKAYGEFLPETKKALTAKGAVLPPYLMRDLAALKSFMDDSGKFEVGAPPAPPKEEPGEWDHLNGYKTE